MCLSLWNPLLQMGIKALTSQDPTWAWPSGMAMCTGGQGLAHGDCNSSNGFLGRKEGVAPSLGTAGPYWARPTYDPSAAQWAGDKRQGKSGAAVIITAVPKLLGNIGPMFPLMEPENRAWHLGLRAFREQCSPPFLSASTCRGLCGCARIGTRNHSSKLSVYLLIIPIS